MNADINVAPLNPFPSLPSTFSPSIPINSFASAFVPVVFLLAFVIWVLYTLVAAYHLFRYGHRSWLTVPALAVHVVISVLIMLYMMSGLI